LPSLAQTPLRWRLVLSSSLTCATGEGRICQNQTIRFDKSDTPVFPKTSDCAPARSISNRAGKPRYGSLVTLSEVLPCSRFDQKVRQHILVIPLGTRSSLAMAHYGMEIYNNNAIMPSFYINPEVRYANYLSTPQAYNTNVVDRCHVVMHVSSNHVNMHNSYSSTDMSRWSNHNAYIFENASNIHNGFAPPASYCTPQTHMPMSTFIAELI
jgi:hypothetical protein